MGRKAVPVTLIDEDRRVLTDRSARFPDARLGLRARIILAAAEGLTNKEIAERLGCSLPTVGKWRRRFVQRGMEGLDDEARTGRPVVYDDAKVQQIVEKTLAPPGDWRGWSTRRLARTLGVSHTTVYRIWKRYNLGAGYGPPPKRRILSSAGNDCAIALYLFPPEAVLAVQTAVNSVGSTPTDRPPLPEEEDPSNRRFFDAVALHSVSTDEVAAGDQAEGDQRVRVSELLYAAVGTACRPLGAGERVDRFVAFLAQLAGACSNDDVSLVVYGTGVWDDPQVSEWLARHPSLSIRRLQSKSMWVRYATGMCAKGLRAPAVSQERIEIGRLVESLAEHAGRSEAVADAFWWIGNGAPPPPRAQESFKITCGF